MNTVFDEKLAGLFDSPTFQLGMSLLGASNERNPWGTALNSMAQFGEAKARRQQQQAAAEYQRGIVQNMDAQRALAAQEAQRAREQQRMAHRFLFGRDLEEAGLFAPAEQTAARWVSGSDLEPVSHVNSMPQEGGAEWVSGYDLSPQPPAAQSAAWTGGYDLPAQNAPALSGGLRSPAVQGFALFDAPAGNAAPARAQARVNYLRDGLLAADPMQPRQTSQTSYIGHTGIQSADARGSPFRVPGTAPPPAVTPAPAAGVVPTTSVAGEGGLLGVASADTMRLPQPLDWGSINAAYAEGQPARDNDRLRILQDELAATTDPALRAALQRDIVRMASPSALPVGARQVDNAETGVAPLARTQAQPGTGFAGAMPVGFQVAPGARRSAPVAREEAQAQERTANFVAGLPRTDAGELDLARMTPQQLQGTSLLLYTLGQRDAAAVLNDMAQAATKEPRVDAGRYQIIDQDGTLLRVDKLGGTVDVLGQSQAAQGAAGSGRTYGKQFRMAADGRLLALDPATGQATVVTDASGQPVHGFTQQPRAPGVSPQAGSGSTGSRGGKGKGQQLVSELPDESLAENISNFDRFMGKVDAIRNSSRLSSQTGLLGHIGGKVPGSGAYDLRADVASLQSELGLASLKQLATAGASLGPYSNADIKLLVSRIENLDPDASAPAFKRALDGVYSEIARIRELHDVELRRRASPAAGTSPGGAPAALPELPRETRGRVLPVLPAPRPALSAPQSTPQSGAGAAAPSGEQKKRLAAEIWGQ